MSFKMRASGFEYKIMRERERLRERERERERERAKLYVLFEKLSYN